MRIPAHSVCTAIRDDIVSGVYERGTRLTEELLARRYGVSRVPVREALRTLEAEGFVVTRRHAGACVAEPTEQDAADLLEIRALLEPLAADEPGAVFDVWQADEDGFYDVQQPDLQPERNLRGLFTTDEQGRFAIPVIATVVLLPVALLPLAKPLPVKPL